MIATGVLNKPRFTVRFQRDRVDVVAGVTVLSEVVERLMMMSGPGASTCPTECGRTAPSRLNEAATTTVPADIAGLENWVENFKSGSPRFGRSPLERSAVNPDAIEDHSDLARDRDLRLFQRTEQCPRVKQY